MSEMSDYVSILKYQIQSKIYKYVEKSNQLS